MAKEIERKFLVTSSAYRADAVSVETISQGYVSRRPSGTVRVRLKGDRGFITLKGVTRSATRSEWEYAVPAADARAMLDELCEGAVIAKTRYRVPGGDGLVWEIDEFHSPASISSLVVAEIELPAEDTPFARPAWLGEEVTGRPEYYNSNLGAQV